MEQTEESKTDDLSDREQNLLAAERRLEEARKRLWPEGGPSIKESAYEVFYGVTNRNNK